MDESQGQPGRYTHRIPVAGLLGILLLFAAGIHAWVIANTYVPARDSIGLLRMADALGSRPWGDVLRENQQPPGYPALVLVFSRLIHPLSDSRGQAETAVFSGQLANALPAILLVIPMFYLGRELFGRRVGFWAALLFQFLPLAAHVTSDVLSEGLFLLLAATALLFACQGLRKRSTVHFLLCGFFSGFAYLTRPEGALIAGVVLLVLVALQFQRTRNWPWRNAFACSICLLTATIAVASPYMFVIGGITNKPAALELFGAAESGQREAGSGERRVESEVGGGVLFAAFSESWGKHGTPSFAWAAWTLAREMVQKSLYVFWLPTLLGLWWFRQRMRLHPGAWVVLLYAVVHAAILCRIASNVGYVSERHTILLFMVGSFWAAAALIIVTSRIRTLAVSRLRLRVFPHCTRLASAVLLLSTVLWMLPWTLAPLHANRAGHREAGRWLATNARPGDIVVDPYCWALYYSGVENPTPENPPKSDSMIWIVIEVTENTHSRLPDVVAAHKLAEQAEQVFSWQPNEKLRQQRAEEVVIWKRPVAGCPAP